MKYLLRLFFSADLLKRYGKNKSSTRHFPPSPQDPPTTHFKTNVSETLFQLLHCSEYFFGFLPMLFWVFMMTCRDFWYFKQKRRFLVHAKGNNQVPCLLLCLKSQQILSVIFNFRKDYKPTAFNTNWTRTFVCSWTSM